MLGAIKAGLMLYLLVVSFTVWPAARNLHRQPYLSIPVHGVAPKAWKTVDAKIIRLLRGWQVPGASVAIMKDHQLIVSRAYGWADIAAHKPLRPNSLFRVASVSKVITAVTILKLAQEHALRLSDSAFKVLGDLKPLPGMKRNQRLNDITIKDLLVMSSGWKTHGANSYDPMFGPWTARMKRHLDNQLPPDCIKATRLMMGIPFRFRPGTDYSYSNINYCILGLLINRATDQPYSAERYESYVQRKILEPLGIYDMHMGNTRYSKRDPKEVHYYPPYRKKQLDITTRNGLPYSRSQVLKKNYAGAGWVASSIDLVKFIEGINDHSILSKKMINKMTRRPRFQKDPKQYFAMGWMVKKINNHKYWIKTGSFTGTKALIMRKDDGTAYTVLMNKRVGSRFIKQLRRLLTSNDATNLINHYKQTSV